MGGGLNEASLWVQVEAMATKLRPHGWTHICTTTVGLITLPALTPT
jgi:hypothetical protein